MSISGYAASRPQPRSQPPATTTSAGKSGRRDEERLKKEEVKAGCPAPGSPDGATPPRSRKAPRFARTPSGLRPCARGDPGVAGLRPEPGA